jgi:hypothetical protein
MSTIGETALIPYGNAAGMPALRVTPASLGDTIAKDAVVALEPYWSQNMVGLWLDGFDWSTRVSELVGTLLADPSWAPRFYLVVFDMLHPEQALPRCTLIADATAALADKFDDASALAVIEGMKPYDHVTDLVVTLARPVGPTVLDRLHAAAGPGAGAIAYIPPGADWIAEMRNSIFHARSPWALQTNQLEP